MSELPTGTVTFLFTDLEGSTRLWEEHPEAMPGALARHDVILQESVEAHGGVVFSRMGDGLAAAFALAPDALGAVLDAQRGLGSEAWGETGPLRVRMGLHTDEGRLRAPGEYVNRPLNRCARLMAIGHGDQVLVSEATAVVAREGLPEGAGFADLGEHGLRDLAQPVRVFQLTHADLPVQFAPLRSLDALPGNLPRQPTEFVGRDQELAELAEALRAARLVTLTGVGGVGKTRLALQAAAQVVPDYREGAWLCELGSLRDADAVPEAVASALDVQAQAGQSIADTLLGFLRSKQLLLVLDNCEHLLDAVARLVERIERDCPHVVVLATSREGLGLRGEQMLAVRSLGLPDPEGELDAVVQADALRLFAARAVESRPGFEVTPENAAVVVDLCRRLDGIPLAIELAAARVRSMTPAELVERLDQRFRLLTGGSRTALERHQTLRGAVDWSYALLGDAERTVLDRLAVFAGGFRLDAAEAVAAGGAVDPVDVLDLLGQLVDKSLLIADDEAGLTRYRLLETIRQYAQERLEQTGEADAVRRRHAEHYVAFAEAAAPHLHGRDQATWIERLEAEIDNLRAVMTWSAGAGDADLALRLVIATNVNAVRTSYTAHAWAEAAVAIPQAATHPLFPDALGWAAWSAVFRNDHDRGRELVLAMHDAERRLDSPPRPARCQAPATLALFSGQLEEAAEHAQRWVALARATNDDEQMVQSLTMLAGVQAFRREFDVALATSEAAVEAARQLGAPGLLSFALAILGGQLRQRDGAGDLERALAVLDEAVQVATLVGNQQAMNYVVFQTAMIRRRQGDHDAALHAVVDAAEAAHHIGNPAPAAVALRIAAYILSDLGEHEPAVTLIGYADRVIRAPLADEWAAEQAAAIAAATETLGSERVTDLERRGAALDDAAAVELGRRAARHALESSRRSAPR